MAFALLQQIYLNDGVLFVFVFLCDFYFWCSVMLLTMIGRLYGKMVKEKYPGAIQNSEGSFESSKPQDIIDIQKLKSDLPLAMKLYYSERTAIINPPNSVKNVAIKMAKKILMY